jgi:predicted transcriptional regulator
MDSMKPRDVVIASKLIVAGGARSYDFLSESLGTVRSQIFSSIKRLERIGLSDSNMKIDKKGFLYFILTGMRYVFPAEKSGVKKGVLTGLGVVVEGEALMIWPREDSEVGCVEGDSIEPLHASCYTALKDRPFWEILALIDCIRAGKGDVKRAAKELKDRL